MADPQATAFTAGEGDRYFERNAHLPDSYDPRADHVVRLLDSGGLTPASVIELGAATGHRVAALVERWGCRGVAVDPSAAATREGQRRFAEVEFVVGTLDAPSVSGAFDVVIVNFVFHWVGRSVLLSSVAAVDLLVADGGHLVIGDFLPAGFARTEYEHRLGLWTYKQDYADVFCSSGLYGRVASLAGRYGGAMPCGDAAPMDRASYTLLHKSLDGYYQSVDL